MKKIIPLTEPYLTKKEYSNILECLRTNWISSQGRFIAEFEKSFSSFCSRRYGVATSNGTTALHLALVTLGIKGGDEVIVPSLSFVAVANAVTYTGARPVFADADKTNWNISPENIERLISCRTKAIIPVHLYGHPADMSAIIKIARKYKLFIVEDAAEAHGAEYKGRKAGSFGDISCFSFYGNKIITTGEGGMLLTDNAKWYNRARILRDHGMSPKRKYWHPEIGFNYRMTNIQAALGLGQVDRIEKIIAHKRKIAALYNEQLKDVRGITLPAQEKWAKNVYWMYSVLIDKEFGVNRDTLMRKLKERGIETRPFFYPLHLLPPYRRKKICKLKNAEELSSRGINLPSGLDLDRKKVEYITRAIKEASKRREKIN